MNKIIIAILFVTVLLFSIAISQKKFTLSPVTNLLPTLAPGPSLTSIPPQSGDLDISVCNPSNGPFSTTIDNEYLPLPVGLIHVLEGATSKVQISVLDDIETVAGVQTRVVEEREWEDGIVSEISRNFFVQAPDGTVCYFGEDVDEYKNDQNISHSGAWRAGEGQNLPGIAMPARPAAGQIYQQEIAPGVAMDRAQHISIDKSFTSRAGTFENVLVVQEVPRSTKRYARGIGLIFDDGALLTSF